MLAGILPMVACPQPSVYLREIALANQSTSKPTTLAEDMHWVLFLREDLQEIRQDQREIRQEQREVRQEQRAMEDRLQARIDSRLALMLVTLLGMTIGFIEDRLPTALG